MQHKHYVFAAWRMWSLDAVQSFSPSLCQCVETYQSQGLVMLVVRRGPVAVTITVISA